MDSTDCDDGDESVRPTAVEACDGLAVDEDCSGRADLDCDDDGSDSVALGGDDCDDADSAVSPSAHEACGDEIDNDCDGVSAGSCAFSGDFSLADAPVRIDGIEGRNFSGGSLVFADFDADGVRDAWESFQGGGGGGFALMRGPLTEDTTLASAVATLQPDARLGNQRVAGAADFDSDGWPDLLVGGTGNDWSGYVGLYYGPFAGGRDFGAAALSYVGTELYEGAGHSVTAGAD